MIRLSEQARPVDRRRENRPGRLTALLGVAVLVAAVPALAASHGGGGHSGGGHSGGGMRSMSSGPSGGSHGSGYHGGSGGNHGGSGGYHGGSGGSHGGTGGYHGGTGYHGGYYGYGYRGGYHGYYGGFHGYYGFHSYFFPRFYFTWGTPFFWGFPYDYWPYYGYGGYGWDGYGYPPYYGYDRVRHEEQGALDLDLSPADTQVFLDGQYIGKVDDFDGWPQYLWLDPGTYDVVFYREGYKTLARQVTIYRGLVVDWTDHLEQGPSIRPEDLPTKSHERRDARLQQDREMQERAERYQRDRDRYYGDRDGDWRDRADRDRDMHRHDADRDDDDDRAPADARDGRHEGHLRLDVRPGDASVYLDGRFVGTAEEVAQGGGLAVSPGNHTLSIVRPGRRAEERRFSARSGEDTTLSIDLQSQ